MASVVERSRTFIEEVVTETKKITWPTREDLKESTRVVVIAVILLSIILGIADWLLGMAMKFILRLA
jgi:preprotein translocase subunit SecE